MITRIFHHVATGTVPIGYRHEYGALVGFLNAFGRNAPEIHAQYATWLRDNMPAKLAAVEIMTSAIARLGAS